MSEETKVIEASNYYKETRDRLIDSYKTAVDQCIDIISQEIDDELGDDKLHSVLKAKKMAAEDSKFYASEVDVMINEKNGYNPAEDEAKIKETPEEEKENWAARRAKKAND